MPPLGSMACAATAESRSPVLWTGASMASSAKEAAAALNDFSQYSEYVAVVGLNRIATLATRGATSLSSSTHLPDIVGSVTINPVALPPSRGKFRDEAAPDRIGGDRENDRNGTCLFQQRHRAGRALRQDQVRLVRDELLGESRHRLHVAWCRPANVHSDIAALRPTKLLNFFPEYPNPGLPFQIALGIYHQHADT